MVCTSTIEEARTALAELFMVAAKAVALRLSEHGLPLTVQVSRTWVQRDSQGGMHTEHREEPRHAFATPGIEYRNAPWLTEAEVEQIHRCSSIILDQFAATLPFYATAGGQSSFLIESLDSHPDEQPDFERDPVDWVCRLLILRALRYHLVRLPGADQADADTANTFADDVLAVARATDLSYLTFVPLSGLDLEPDKEALHEGDVIVRRLSEVGQGEWFDGGSECGLWRPEGFSDPPRVLVEIRSFGPRDKWFWPSRDRAARLVAAFHLHRYRVAGSVVAESADPPWTSWAMHSGPLMVPRHSASLSILTADVLREVLATLSLLENYNLQEPQSSKDLALHRFANGLARTNAADAVLDFIIALEALLLPYDRNARHGDLSYRFRVHGAHYLSSDAAERTTTFNRMRNLYDMRSRLVHGGKYPDAAKIEEARSEAHEMAARGLLRALQEGFPTAEMFRSMVLGFSP